MNKITGFLLFGAPLCLFLFSPCLSWAGETGDRSPNTAAQSPPGIPARPSSLRDELPKSRLEPMTPAQEYAGEIMAYLLRVVLGRAGRLELRGDWQIRGFDEPLDYGKITQVMTRPKKNQLALMVLDPNILDLTRTLYYYDERLSLYKGDYNVASIYPAPEFVAIRLLLLQKIRRGERIDLEALVEREGLLFNTDLAPSPEDLRRMNLRPRELKLIRDVIRSEPRIYQYLKSPFLVKALHDTWAINGGEFVRRKIRQANYRIYPCRPLAGPANPNAVKILFLTTMTREFTYGDADALPPYGFRPTEFVEEMVKRFRSQILAAAKARLRKEMAGLSKGGDGILPGQWEILWPLIAREYITFYVEDERPLVIYPENAEQVSRDVCPQARFTVVLMGRNIYKAIYFDGTRDVYPRVDRLFVDMMDIKHSESGEEAGKVGEFICSRIRSRLPDLARELGIYDHQGSLKNNFAELTP